MVIATICIGSLGILVFGLGLAVSLTRQSTKTSIGHSHDPADRLHKVVRAHANTCEFAPMLAVLFLVIGWRGPGALVQLLMVLATAARYSIVAGLILTPTLDKPHPLRFAGALGTYICGLLLCLVALLGA